jgi:hypothetical protein
MRRQDFTSAAFQLHPSSVPMLSNAHPENKFFCGMECQGGLKGGTHVA